MLHEFLSTPPKSCACYLPVCVRISLHQYPAGQFCKSAHVRAGGYAQHTGERLSDTAKKRERWIGPREEYGSTSQPVSSTGVCRRGKRARISSPPQNYLLGGRCGGGRRHIPAVENKTLTAHGSRGAICSAECRLFICCWCGLPSRLSHSLLHGSWASSRGRRRIKQRRKESSFAS